MAPGAMLLRGLSALILADVAWLALAPSDVATNYPFQSAVSGLGGGHGVGVDWSFHGFDPRLAARCENEGYPIPGTHCPNPQHGACAVDRPPLDLLR